VPTTEVMGMDRRAFGEFVGPRGELASYAFGWNTGSQPHVARLSIGIGVGKPGGGTFHVWYSSIRTAMRSHSPTSGSSRYHRAAQT
jgi:hypothetical protein